MKKFKDFTELNEMIRDTVKETIRETVTDSLKEKTDAFRALPVAGQIGETFRTFCKFSAESAKLLVTALQCFGIFITLVYAVRELIKEMKSPL